MMTSAAKLGRMASPVLNLKHATHQTVEEIRRIFQVFGMESAGDEGLSYFAHCAQAAMLAKKESAGEDVQIAAFLHELGKMLPAQDEATVFFGKRNYEKEASRWLAERGFSKQVCTLVQNHLHAKRYLMYQHPWQLDKILAGNEYASFHEPCAMTDLEADAFQQQPYLDLMLSLRNWDEEAHNLHFNTPDLEYFLDMIRRHLDKNN